MLKEWTIGRMPDNDYVIDQKEVSRYHAKLLQITENTYLLTDNESAGGTRVNGVKIARIVLGISDKFEIAGIVVKVSQIVNLPPPPPDPETIYLQQELDKLELIWKEYHKFQTLSAATSVVITAAGTIVGGLLIPGFGVLLGGTIAKLGSLVLNKPEAYKFAEIEFKAKYKCPKCRYHFAGIAFADLKRQNKCPQCDVVFVKQ